MAGGTTAVLHILRRGRVVLRRFGGLLTPPMEKIMGRAFGRRPNSFSALMGERGLMRLMLSEVGTPRDWLRLYFALQASG